ncbi:Hypothetical protein BHY_1216 (plasmid) [Borrelia nietonii YOR]|nr:MULTISPECIES: hypothetical protein [Borrelia]AHH04167.1 Hypothetical protein BHY_1216 [Borrelia nietonii YOR]UPA10022.1 hypothetical protein bhYOR_001367 [Borrelia nietonii YOR]
MILSILKILLSLLFLRIFSINMLASSFETESESSRLKNHVGIENNKISLSFLSSFG